MEYKSVDASGDVSALLKAGVLDRVEDGRIEFPSDRDG